MRPSVFYGLCATSPASSAAGRVIGLFRVLRSDKVRRYANFYARFRVLPQKKALRLLPERFQIAIKEILTAAL
jgi:hypothetical protein